ncbi:metal ABC transporter permease [Paracoccus sp. M683]|uniref:metal ABC transporter permease n=1 Tax=Paracoccus sp. M683 TaxID=2594268 RepID=UPI0011807892|nr:metal ABC transporter permease [Paracoccus sp. M683]TRW95195.1 metal ABC transporter permease [Paracoccus sp. M683]
MTEWLLAPFQYGFMREAFTIAAIIAVPAALLSCFLVLKGWSLMGDAVSHAVLPGVVLAYILGAPLVAGAFVAGVLCALAAGFLQENSRVKQDTVLGVVMSGMFAAGMVLYVAIPSSMDLYHILFGNIFGVTEGQIIRTAIIALLVSAAILTNWRDLALHSFDPVQARVVGLPVRWLHYGLLAAISLTVVAMLSAVGIILAVGLLIAPGAIAFLLTRRMQAMLAAASAVSLFSCLGGVWISFWIDSAPAPTIVMVLTAIFVAAFIWRQIRNRSATQGVTATAEAKLTAAPR